MEFTRTLRRALLSIGNANRSEEANAEIEEKAEVERTQLVNRVLSLDMKTMHDVHHTSASRLHSPRGSLPRMRLLSGEVGQNIYVSQVSEAAHVGHDATADNTLITVRRFEQQQQQIEYLQMQVSKLQSALTRIFQPAEENPQRIEEQDNSSSNFSSDSSFPMSPQLTERLNNSVTIQMPRTGSGNDPRTNPEIAGIEEGSPFFYGDNFPEQRISSPEMTIEASHRTLAQAEESLQPFAVPAQEEPSNPIAQVEETKETAPIIEASLMDDPFAAIEQQAQAEIQDEIVLLPKPKKKKKKGKAPVTEVPQLNLESIQQDIAQAIEEESKKAMQANVPTHAVKKHSSENLGKKFNTVTFKEQEQTEEESSPAISVSPFNQSPVRIGMHKTSSAGLDKRRRKFSKLGSSIEVSLDTIKEVEQEAQDALNTNRTSDETETKFKFLRMNSINTYLDQVSDRGERSVNNRNSLQLFQRMQSVPNKRLKFMLSAIDVLKLPRQDVNYLQSIFDIIEESSTVDSDSDSQKFAMPPVQLDAFRKQSLKQALSGKPSADMTAEMALVTDALFQACQNLARQNEALQTENAKIKTYVSQQTMQMKEFKKMYVIEQMQLHFTFMFACPLVMTNNSELKQVPALKYEKEFTIIKEKMTESKLAIRYFRRQCTVESLQEVLTQKPLGMHFSGHGIKNTPELGDAFYEQNKGQGDFLLLETLDGDSQLVSRDRLKDIISKAECNLEFVVVLTCHSQFVGEIFLQAGTKHVVCIHKDFEVDDEAAMTFTETFYRSLFQQNMEICRAFGLAKQSVGIKHGEEQEDIFLLLVYDPKQIDCIHMEASCLPKGHRKKTTTIRSQKHRCIRLFGKKTLYGESVDLGSDSAALNTPTRQTSLIGRFKEMYKLIQKLLLPNSGKIFTVWGQHGVGKTALVKAVMHYVNERNLIKGGFSFINANSLISCEILLRNFNMQLVRDNPLMFGQIMDSFGRQNKDQMSLFVLILKQIGQLELPVVFVIDSCEGLISSDKMMFKSVLKLILAEIPKSSVVLTSTMRIKDDCENVIVIDGLSQRNAFQLFKDHCQRVIEVKEQNALLQLKPDSKRYPELANQVVKKYQDHHLFTLIGGNPQSILLIAPLLKDPYNNHTLVDLYKMLTSEEMDKILINEQINKHDVMSASMRLTIEAAFKNIAESDQEALKLFFIVSMFPAGILVKDLEYVWGRLNRAKQGNNWFQQTKVDYQMQQTWKRAWHKLEAAKMLEKEKLHHDESHDISCAPDLEEFQQGDWLIRMPIYLRNYAECNDQKFDELISELEDIVAQFLLKNRLEVYRMIKRSYSNSNNIQDNSRQFNYKKNQVIEGHYMEAFFKRVSEKIGGDNILVEEEEKDSKMLDAANMEESREESSLSSSGESVKSEPQNAPRVSVTYLSLEPELKPEKQVTAPLVPFIDRRRGSTSSFVLNHFKALLERAQENKQKSKAKQRWQWAYLKIKKLLRAGKQPDQIAFIQQSARNREENEQSQERIRSSMSVSMLKLIKSKMIQLQSQGTINLEKDMNTLEQQIEFNNKIFLKNKHRSNIRKFVTQMTRMKTMAQPQKKGPEEHFLLDLKVGTRMSLGFEPQVEPQCMTIEENIIVLHLLNLLLEEMHEVAKQHIQTYFQHTDLCTSIFRGNLKRIHALCMLPSFEEKLTQYIATQKPKTQKSFGGCLWAQPGTTIMTGLTNDYLQMQDLLARSYLHFKEKRCYWGMGQVKYQSAFVQDLILTKILDQEQLDVMSGILNLLASDSEKAMHQCIQTYKQAYDHFGKIQHLRGTALCARGMVSMYSKMARTEAAIDEVDDNDSFKSEDVSWNSENSDDEHSSRALIFDISKNIFKLTKTYKLSIQSFFREQALADRDCCISRKQGEEFSLLTEIAKSASVQFLFGGIKRMAGKVMKFDDRRASKFQLEINEFTLNSQRSEGESNQSDRLHTRVDETRPTEPGKRNTSHLKL